MAELGVELPDWTPPPWPGPMRLDGRYARIEPLVPAHAKALFAANREDDRIWDYLPYGPFPNEAAFAAWVVQMAGKADPLFFAVIDRERRHAGGRGEPDADRAGGGVDRGRPHLLVAGAAGDAGGERGDLSSSPTGCSARATGGSSGSATR